MPNYSADEKKLHPDHGSPLLLFQEHVHSLRASCVFAVLDPEGAVSKAAVLIKVPCVVLVHMEFHRF